MAPLMLDLFTGTGSVSKVFRENGWDTFTLDIDPACNADLTCDILELTREQLPPPESVFFIWASPPCTSTSGPARQQRNRATWWGLTAS